MIHVASGSRENDKKDMGKNKIDEKVFEIERPLLIGKRG
jgi:hypothetical protein